MVAADAIRHAFGDNLPPLDFLVDIVLVPDFFEEDFGEDFGEDFEDPLVAGAGAPPLDFDFLATAKARKVVKIANASSLRGRCIIATGAVSLKGRMIRVSAGALPEVHQYIT